MGTAVEPMNGAPPGSRRAWIVALAATALVAAAMLAIRPAVALDAIRGVASCEEHLAGRPNRLSELTIADPADLSRDLVYRLTWWPPGHQMVYCAIRRTGPTPGTAVRLLVFGAWVAGLVAWGRYFSLSLEARELLPWLVAAFACYRLSHASAAAYLGGETVLWAVAPAVVLLNLRALAAAMQHRGSRLLIPVAGAFAALLVLLKYSAALIALGLAAAWLWVALRRECRMRAPILWGVGAAIGLALAFGPGQLPIFAGTTPGTPLMANPTLASSIWALTGPALAAGDVARLFDTVSSRVGWGSPWPVPVAGAGLGVLALVWLGALRQAGVSWSVGPSLDRTAAWRIAGGVTMVTCAGLLVLVHRGGTISMEGRHHQYAALFLLPFLVDFAWRGLRARSGPARALSRVAAAVLVWPAVFGLVVLAAEVHAARLASDDIVNSRGLTVPWAAGGEGALAFERELSSLPIEPSTIVATTTFRVTLMLPAARAFILMDEGDWREQRLRGVPAGGVLVVLPPGIDRADAEACLRTFVDVREWSPVALKSVPAALVWRGR